MVAAAYNNVNVEVPEFKMGVDNKTPAFLAMNPLGKVPTLETPQGPIFESNAIARYVARVRTDTDLYGSSFYESAQVDQWVDACANELEPALTIILFKLWNYMPVSDDQHKEAVADVHKFLRTLDEYLLTRTYVVGQKVTLADIALVAALTNIFEKVLSASDRSNYVNVNRWYKTCRFQAPFVKVMGAFDENASGSSSSSASASSSSSSSGKGGKDNKKEEGNKKGGDKDKKGGEKKEKPAAEEKPKKDKKKKDEDEDMGDETFEEPKKENPLDTLPPTKMNLDATKRLFFEKRPNFDLFFKEFWNFFDSEGYCIYFTDYRYNDDNKVYFMTCNLTAGYIQRLDELRKYSFGVLNVTGVDEDTAPFNVNGCFIFRGQGVPAEMSECPDTEYYELRKADIKSEKDRKLIEAAFYSDKYNGFSVLDRKYFK